MRRGLMVVVAHPCWPNALDNGNHARRWVSGDSRLAEEPTADVCRISASEGPCAIWPRMSGSWSGDGHVATRGDRLVVANWFGQGWLG